MRELLSSSLLKKATRSGWDWCLTPSRGHPPPNFHTETFPEKEHSNIKLFMEGSASRRNVWRADLQVFKSLKWSWRNWLRPSLTLGDSLPQRRGTRLSGKENLGRKEAAFSSRLLAQLWSNLPLGTTCPATLPVAWSGHQHCPWWACQGSESSAKPALRAAQTQSKSSHSPLWVTWESVLNCVELRRRWQKEKPYELASKTSNTKRQIQLLKHSLSQYAL